MAGPPTRAFGPKTIQQCPVEMSSHRAKNAHLRGCKIQFQKGFLPDPNVFIFFAFWVIDIFISLQRVAGKATPWEGPFAGGFSGGAGASPAGSRKAAATGASKAPLVPL